MKPEVLKVLQARFPTELITSFEMSTRDVRNELSEPRAKESQVNAQRLSILDQLQNPRSNNDFNRAVDRLKNNYVLWRHVNLHCQLRLDLPISFSIEELLAVPYVYVPPQEWALIRLCINYYVRIERGNNGFSVLAKMLLVELDDNRANSKQALKAFRYKVIDGWIDMWARRVVTGPDHHMRMLIEGQDYSKNIPK